jgi:ABC-2 type transport system ATP-binding protein
MAQQPLNGDPAIYVAALVKRYGEFEAVRGIDFQVSPGEVFGMLGPNGAGKTTTVEILEGLRERTSGDVRVLGMDPMRQVSELKDRIGACLQATNLPDKIKVGEAVELFGAFYSRRVDADALLERLQLTEKRHTYYSHLSCGQKQRLAIAMAMINDPSLVFLDEPTTGLDPQARLEIHKLIEELRREKRTILLTTHYIEEAERLCDRVAIIDQGSIIAMGTPREIQARTLGQARIEIECVHPIARLDGEMPAACERATLSADRRTLVVNTVQPARAVVELVKWIDQQGNELADIHLKRPTLEDVFLELTGKRLRE